MAKEITEALDDLLLHGSPEELVEEILRLRTRLAESETELEASRAALLGPDCR